MKIYIEQHRQFIKVSSNDLDALILKLRMFNFSLTTKKLEKRRGHKKFQLVEDKKFFIVDMEEQCIRYLVSGLKPLLEYIKANRLGEVQITPVDPPPGMDIEFHLDSKFKPRDYQVPYIEKVVAQDAPTVLIDLPTGKGKTFTSLYAIQKIGKRFGILVLPRYLDKWLGDIEKYTDIKREDVFVVDGRSALLKLMRYLKNNEANNYKVILMSLSTIRVMLDTYLSLDKEYPYPMQPEQFFRELNLGVLLNDETHQEFHNVYKTLLFAEVNLFIGLTATLTNKDRRLQDIYYVMFPEESRVDGVEFDRYINVVAIGYKFRNPKRIKVTSGYGYSQVEFEKSIMRNEYTLNNYLNMIADISKAAFIEKSDRRPDDKYLIFAGTIDMCRYIVDKLSTIITLKISKYTEEDPYEVIEESNIIVSTILSAGTALDIPNLTDVLQTVAVDSIAANKQTIGRLREIPGREVTFHFTWCKDIRQHKKYLKNRIEYFKDKAKSFRFIDYKKPI